MGVKTIERKIEIHKLYNGEIELAFEPSRHIYSINNRRIIGVTTVTSVIDKPALIQWAVNKAVDLIEFKLRQKKRYNYFRLMDIFKEAKYAHTKEKQTAADLGTRAHLWAEMHIKGMKPVLPRLKPLRIIINNFLEWVEKNDVKFLESEKKIYSRRHDYAGTMDTEAVVNGKLCVVDFKTSTGIWNEYRFQLAAYREAREEELGKRYDASWIVRFAKSVDSQGLSLSPHPFESLYIPTEEHQDDFNAFLGALAVKRRLDKIKHEKAALKSILAAGGN